MKWYKHYSDNHRGTTIQRILDDVGREGAFILYVIMELCAEKLERCQTGLSENDCEFTFNWRVVEQATRSRRSVVGRVTAVCASTGWLTASTDDNEITFKFPMLLNLLDRDTKKARLKRDTSAHECRLDKDKDKDKEEERESHLVVLQTTPALVEIWNSNCGELPKVEKLNKSRLKKIKAIFNENTEIEWAQIIKRITESNFCCGKNDRGWRATFDWLLQPDTHLKISEGKYDNRVAMKKDIVAEMSAKLEAYKKERSAL